MGVIQHDVVVATATLESAIEVIRVWIGTAPPKDKILFLESPSLTNGTVTFICVPDGSKEGWSESDHGDKVRADFVEFLESLAYDDGSSSVDWITCNYGEFGARLIDSNCSNEYDNLDA